MGYVHFLCLYNTLRIAVIVCINIYIYIKYYEIASCLYPILPGPSYGSPPSRHSFDARKVKVMAGARVDKGGLEAMVQLEVS